MFGTTNAASTAAATSADWPATLGRLAVAVVDSARISRPAQITYASPTQVNYVVPAGTAAGKATVRFTVNGTTATGSLNVVATYPTLFPVKAPGLAGAYVLQSV